ncbi:MAG: DUF6463 family protein [Acidobacteriota bacterium]
MRRIGDATTIIGLGHTLLGLYRFHGQFLEMAAAGLFATGAGELRGWAFWFTFSGLLMMVLGRAMGALERRGLPIPRSLGLWILLSSALGAAVFPVSGFWLLIGVALAILGTGR